ncbi:MAG: M13 family metallopeptidase [Paludibacteraceae bacterium]|nr:M13 family metallopeptidase [Paludibacteraceae bacterium]
MKKHFFYMISMAAMMASCSDKGSDIASLSAGIKQENFDTTASPVNDFYQYACGGWMKNNPLTGEYARFGSFDKLAEDNKKQLNDLIVEIASQKHEPGSVSQKIGDLYNLMMDTARLEKEGIDPIKPDLAKIDGVTDKASLFDVVVDLQLKNVDLYFALYVGADPKNSNVNILQTYQSGYALGERDYYIGDDENSVKIREKYKEHIEKMLLLCGYPESVAKRTVESVMQIETRLAKVAYDKVKERDPLANYHKMSVDSLGAIIPNFDWKNYFSKQGLDVNELNVSQIEPVQEAVDIFNGTDIEVQKDYLRWKLIDEAASCLNSALDNQNFEFYGKTISGRTEQSPRWKRAEAFVSSSLGEAVGQMYVAKYFPEESKKRMLELVGNLQKTLGHRIERLSWMSDTTKQKALEKLDAFHVKIGYPDKWKDYSSLQITDGSLWENRCNVVKFRNDEAVAKAGKPVDKDEWHMTPQTVNAYYNPTTNEICFPAGILQYPFFDMNADDAFNYGAIGVVIGHEMTHGFDDQGSQFDKDGNLNNWWTAADSEAFKARTVVMANFFDSIEVAPGVFANGKFTLGENIADHGGLQIAFEAFKDATANAPLPVKDGFTAEQRFFLAYANVWAGNIREEEILRRTKVDPHSLGRWRVNGALPHIQAWYDAFNVQPSDSLFVSPDKRVEIW